MVRAVRKIGQLKKFVERNVFVERTSPPAVKMGHLEKFGKQGSASALNSLAET